MSEIIQALRIIAYSLQLTAIVSADLSTNLLQIKLFFSMNVPDI